MASFTLFCEPGFPHFLSVTAPEIQLFWPLKLYIQHSKCSLANPEPHSPEKSIRLVLHQKIVLHMLERIPIYGMLFHYIHDSTQTSILYVCKYINIHISTHLFIYTVSHFFPRLIRFFFLLSEYPAPAVSAPPPAGGTSRRRGTRRRMSGDRSSPTQSVGTTGLVVGQPQHMPGTLRPSCFFERCQLSKISS